MKYLPTKYPNIFTYETKNGKRYYVRRGYYLNGKKKEATKSNLKTLTEAKLALSEMIQKIENNEFVYQKNLTLDQYWAIYSEKMIKTERWSPDTEANKFTNYKNHFQARYGKCKLKNILRDEYELYINQLLEKYTKNTVRQLHGIFTAILNDALQCKYLDDNPIDKVYIGKSPKKPKKKQVSLAEFKAFDQAAREILDDYDYTIVRLSYFGLRRSEILGLRMKSPILGTDGRYTLEITSSRTKRRKDDRLKTTSSHRLVSLDLETSQLLGTAIQTSRLIASKYNRILSQDDYLFLNDDKGVHKAHRGQPLHYHRIGYLFDVVNQACGLELTPHMMRHFFATQGVVAGIPIEHMAAALGHSTSYMTSKYTHIQDEVSASVTDTFMKVIQ